MNFSNVPLWAWALGAAGAAGVAAVVSRTGGGGRVPTPPAQIRALINSIFPLHGIPVWYALTNAALESGFDPGAALQAGRDDSHGLMQINLLVPDVRAAMEREGLTQQDLYDPETNLRFWAKHLAGVFLRGARAHGYGGDAAFEALRLRLAGIGWDYIAGAGPNAAVRRKTAAIKARLWRYAARFR